LWQRCHIPAIVATPVGLQAGHLGLLNKTAAKGMSTLRLSAAPKATAIKDRVAATA